MTGLLDELLPASFRSVPFLIDGNSNTIGGRKTVTHEFVNANHRNVEDLGLLNKTFSVTAIIHGDQYFAKRDALIAAIDQGGSGTLVHPFYGTVEVVAKPYSISEDLTNLGEAKFNLLFEAQDNRILPQETSDNSAVIRQQADAVVDLTQTKTGDNYSVADGNPESYANSEALLDDFTTTLDDISVNNTTNDYNSAVNSFDDNKVSNISSPTALAASISSVISAANDISTDPQTQIDNIATLFGFNSTSEFTDIDINVGNEISAQLAEIVINQRTLTEQINVSALAYAYRNIIDIEFFNVDQLDTELNRLEDEYQNYVESTGINADILHELQLLRANVEQFLDLERIAVSKLIDINIKEMPAQVLGYLLYGDDSKTNELIEINDIANVSHVSGDVRALSNDFT